MPYQKTYYSGKYLRGGLTVWKDMFLELVDARELLWRLFVKDLRAKYRQSVIGIVWAFIMPFVMIGSFVYLNKAGIVDVGATNIPYPLFALLGIAFWQVFATGINGCTNSMVSAGGVIVKINFPKKTLVIAALGQTLFEFAIRLILVGLAFLFYGIIPSWHIILLPIAIIPLLLITLSLGFFLALLNAVIRDIANIVAVLIPFMMFITPVMYVPKAEGFTALINRYNPICSLVIFLRNLVLGTQVSIFPDYFILLIFSILFLLLGLYVMHIVEPRLAERL